MSTFDARWRGKCAACGEWFAEGTEIRYDGDDIVHADCDAATVREEPYRAPCASCFMVPAVNGECGCDA